VLEAFEAGSARHLLDLVRHVEGVDHLVVVPARRVGGQTDPGAAAALQRAGAAVHVVPMRRAPAHPVNAGAVGRVARLVRAAGADVVHGHSSIGGAVARLAGAITRRPVVYTPHALADGRVAAVVERALAARTARFVAVSPSEAEVLARRRLGRGDRVVVIPNGIDPRPPEPRDLHAVAGTDPARPLVVAVGRLAPQKAPLDLLDAWAAIAGARPEVQFVLVGDGRLAPDVDRRLAAVPLGGRATRLAFLADAAAYLPSAAVVTSASVFEAGPYVVLEAMRAGVPVVATDVVGTRDAVGDAGVLVPPRRPDALAAAVVALLGDEDRRRSMGAAGVARVAEDFDVAEMGRRLGRLYGSLL
jgi:glycosyltransferase involved in cell wall biosynthesis